MKHVRIHVKTLLVFSVLIFGVVPTYADVWGDLAKGLLNGLNSAVQVTEKQMVENVIKDPSKHSADMAKFLKNVNEGNNLCSEGEMSAAWSYFYNAKRIAENTADRILHLAYAKYGWKSELENIMVVCWNASQSGSGSGGNSYNSNAGTHNSGSSSSSGTCSKCHGKKSVQTATERELCFQLLME